MNTKETWEVEYDDKIMGEWLLGTTMDGDNTTPDCAAIKAFIAAQIQKAKLEVIGAVEGYPTPQIGDKNGAWAEELKGFKMVLVYSLKSKYTK